MALPSDGLPEWATSGAVVEPSPTKKALGWVPNEFPPAQTFNWLGRSTFEWLQWLSSVLRGTELEDWSLAFGTVDASVTPLEISAKPEDDTTVVGNAWRPLIKAEAGTDRFVGLYTSKLANSYSLAMVVNARWDVPTQKWVQTNAAQRSLAFTFDTAVPPAGGVLFWSQPSGSSPWSTWALPGSIGVEQITAFEVLVGTSFTLAGSAGMAFATPRAYSDILDIRAGTSATGDIFIDNASGKISSASGSMTMYVPLCPMLPRGSTLTGVQLACDTTAGGSITLEVLRDTTSFTTGSNTRVSMASGGAVSTSGSSVQVITFTPNQNALVQANAYAVVRVTFSGTDPSCFPGLQFSWNQPNPHI